VAWGAFLSDFLARAQAELCRAAAEIAHLKVLLTAEGGRLQANLTGNAARPMMQGELARLSRHAALVVNARVRTSPEHLKAVIEDSLRRAAGGSIEVHVAEMTCSRPGRPKPVHRFDAVG
jgi:hypothetical protein